MSDKELLELPDLTSAELTVMKALWAGERQSAREVHDQLGDSVEWAYSTTRTVLDRMAKKGLVARVPFHGLYLFSPRVSRPRGLASLVRQFAESVLEVPASRVVSLFSESEALTAMERDELLQLIEASSLSEDRDA